MGGQRSWQGLGLAHPSIQAQGSQLHTGLQGGGKGRDCDSPLRPLGAGTPILRLQEEDSSG